MRSTSSPEAHPSRRQILFVALSLLVAFGALGTTFYLRSQLYRQPATQAEAHVARVRAEQAAIEPSPEEVAQRHAHYRQLRAKWRPWALKNKELLRKMLHSPGTDPSALFALEAAAPMIPTIETAGFSIAELNGGNEKLSLFTWEPIAKISKDPQSIAKTRQILQRGFTQVQDYNLSMSNNKGRSTTYLWASGRITERKEIDNPKGDLIGQPATIDGPFEKIEPPYDFLS